MKKLHNSLYVTTEDAYLRLDGENVVGQKGADEAFRVPLLNLESIVVFNYIGVSPALMGKCAESGVDLSFIRPSGRFLARVTGPRRGSVHLRRAQIEKLGDREVCLDLAKREIAAKLYNTRAHLLHFLRDRNEDFDKGDIEALCETLKSSIDDVRVADSAERVRGIEGHAAERYFQKFDRLILSDRIDFRFINRTKRPPLDPVNAMLSFLYSLLTKEVVSALETVGLDAYVGFFHTDRAGRPSLALDLVEELRSYFVDRLVLKLINRSMIKRSDIVIREGGAVMMNDDVRKTLIKEWQNEKREEIYHGGISEKIEIGLLPYVQARLLSKYLRGETEEYSPFLVK